MPVDDAVRASAQRQAAGTHRLDLAIAHAGEISADDITSRLEHALLMDKCPGVETRPPRSAEVWIYSDRRVHAAGLGTNRVDRGHNEIWCAARELKMGAGLGLRVDPRMLVEQQPIDRRRDYACHRVAPDDAVMSSGPYRHATAQAPSVIEKIRQPDPAARAALVRRQNRIGSRQRPLSFLQFKQFLAGRKNIA
jgi:hypothetical protein